MRNFMDRWMNGYARGPEDGGGGEAPSSTGGGDGGAGGTAPSSAPSGGSGAAPAPSATPTPTTSAPAADTGMDWSALGSTEDLDYQIEVSPEPAPVEVEPQPTPKPEPVPTPAPPPKPLPHGPMPEPPQPPRAGEDRPLTAAEPWRIAEGIEANRDAIVAHLAQAKFALSEADIKELDTDVVAAVPKLLARVFLESQVSMQKFLAQAVPGMMKQYNTVSSANDAAEKQFFDTHKGLDINNPAHRAAAVRIATVYRQANPGIPLKQLIAEVGPMVMATLQINAATAQQPVVGAPVVPRGNGAFRPAIPGGGGHSPAPAPEGEWAGLGRDYD